MGPLEWARIAYSSVPLWAARGSETRSIQALNRLDCITCCSEPCKPKWPIVSGQSSVFSQPTPTGLALWRQNVEIFHEKYMTIEFTCVFAGKPLL